MVDAPRPTGNDELHIIKLRNQVLLAQSNEERFRNNISLLQQLLQNVSYIRYFI